jgi:putative transposase
VRFFLHRLESLCHHIVTFSYAEGHESQSFRVKPKKQRRLQNMTRGSEKKKKLGGTGFQPVHSFTTTRRCLPHWQQPGSVYFITWRCKTEYQLSPEERSITLEALQYWEGKKWTVYAAVVMPDNVHALVRPLPLENGGIINLGEILQSVKGFSAWKINRYRKTKGPLWQDERYDRIVRDEAEFLEKWNYIRNNPVKTGLADTPEDYFWLYEKSG